MHELKHYGVLGMKWGVRRYQNKDGSLTDAGRRKLSKQDKKWQRRVERDNNGFNYKVYNAGTDYYNEHIDEVNKKYKDSDLAKGYNTAIGKKYLKEVFELSKKSYQFGADQLYGVNPSGTKKVEAVLDELGDMPMFRIIEINK